jgi:hypothetical protein
MKAHCRSDYMAKCAGVPPGGKDALQCLQRHVNGLSPGCKSAVAATMPRSAPPPAAAAPARTKPKAVARPAPAPAAPPPAAAPVRPSAAAQEAMKAHCRSDFMAKCSGVAPGGRDALQCLQRNVNGLSPGCRSAVASTMPNAAPSPAAAPGAAAAAPAQPDPAVLAAKAAKLPLPKLAAVRRACNEDLVAVCPNVRPGGGRIVICLAQNSEALSPFCRQTVTGALQ